MSEKRIGIFDVDGTIYRDSLMIDLIDRLRAMNLLTNECFATSDRLRRQWKDREAENSYESFAEALVQTIEQEQVFRCRSEDVRRICADLIDQKGRQVYEFTRELIYTLLELDYTLVAISGSPLPAVEMFVRQFGFQHVRATEYEMVDGAYTGKIMSLPVQDKAAAARQFLDKFGADFSNVIAVGDTISDYELLVKARYPIAFNPSRKLKTRIRSHGGVIWKRSFGVVTQRKDDIAVMKFGDDMFYRTRLEECLIREIFPRDVADRLSERLRSYIQY